MKMSTKTAIHIHKEGKIDIHNSASTLRTTLEKIRTDVTILEANRRLIDAFVADCLLGKTVVGKRRKKLGATTCLKHIFALTLLERRTKISFAEFTSSVMETFVHDLDEDLLTTRGGRAYSQETKAGIKKSIRKFWKWKDGASKTYPDIVEWIDTYSPVSEIGALTRAEVELMIDHSAKARDKALLMVLFDSGARAEELLNVRLKREHISWKDEFACYTVRLEFSKTKPRTISLPLSSKHLGKWLEAHPEKGNPDAQLFPITYGNLRMLVRRLGRRVLKKRVTPHMLRHSSATYYANRLKNPYKLCYRYGWTMSSKMVDRYLDREGILEEETPGVVKADEIGRANRQSEVLREELVLLREAQSDLNVRHHEVVEELGILKSGKGVLGVIAALVRQQREMAEVLKKLSGKDFDVILDGSGLM